MKNRHVCSTLEKNTIRASLDMGLSENDFSSFAALAAKVAANIANLMARFPNVFNITYENVYIAYALSYAARLALDCNAKTACEYVAYFAKEKQDNELDINDYGAFGDLYELLVRLAFVGHINLVRASSLRVKEQGRTDLISRKYGRIEIGHNGKTLTSATAFDYMEGNYDSVVYGVFDFATKLDIYNLCAAGRIMDAVKVVKAYSCYWSDKYSFQQDMDGLSRGAGITYKAGIIQVVFNESKYNAFVGAIEEGKFTTLEELLP